ncbi:uncharacterized protein IWZ02DRAFT_213930 [Phyllosticta citriasiana]|uniref:Phytanoyl-CoA dioxygenase n=1 Tax=Phyllosticta citriasiana TaxID=595635 RepID=A0ABR1KPG3_9PEZI
MPQPVPLQRLPYTAPREAFIKALEKDGCVIIQNFTDRETLARAKAEVQPYLDAEEKGSKVGALEGKTKTCTRLIGRSATVRNDYFSDPLYQGLVDHFLTLTTTCWYGCEPSTTVSPPLLSIAITMDIRPGTPAQRLHRDDKNHHARHTAASSYEYSSNGSRDVLLGLFVPGCDTTRANGATRVVPGSHLWGDERPEFGDDGIKGVVDVELEAGEAVVMLGSLYHGGGEYSRMDGKSRTMHIMFCCSGVYRQEEISFLSYPVEEVKTYSPLVQQRLGWKQSEPNLGWVDLKSPEFLLK